MRACGVLAPLNQRRGGYITKDKVAISVAPFQVPRADFWVHDQCRADGAGADHIRGSLNAKGCGRTSDIHIKRKAVDTQELLDLDGDGRIGSLHIGSCANHQIDVCGSLPRLRQRFLGGIDGHFRHDARLVIAALPQLRVHDFGVKHTGFIHDKAVLDTGGFEDKFLGGVLEGLALTGGDGLGMLCVLQVHIGVEGLDQFCVGDAFGWGVDPGAGNGSCVHFNVPGRGPTVRALSQGGAYRARFNTQGQGQHRILTCMPLGQFDVFLRKVPGKTGHVPLNTSRGELFGVQESRCDH